ncbi:MAG: hypothetical protein IJJ15_08355 [Ruminococcus sp.]|nr:hypothetical protein [Ruminococcus sp.]MBQ6153743.1 hypothetical protein [Ruminococcus sp.]
MKKLTSLLLAAVIGLTLCAINVGAVPAEDLIDLYAQDIVFTNSLGFIDPVIYYQSYSRYPSEDWDSAPMVFVQTNDYDEGMYYFNFPAEGYYSPENVGYAYTYSFYISDAYLNGRTETLTHQMNDPLDLFLTGETDYNGYYKAIIRHIWSENLIVLDNTDNVLSDNIYICIRCIDPFTGDGSDIRAKTERFDFNDYGEGRYRFTAPNGTQSFYFTDGRKRTADMPFSGAEWLWLSGDRDDEGNYQVCTVNWGGGPDDPVYTMGPSDTIFDRFFEKYVSIYTYDVAPENVYWSDFFYLYDEPYEHRDQSGDADWVLIQAETFIAQDVIYEGIIGNRLVIRPTPSYPFESGYGIYDVKQDIFVSLPCNTESNYDGLTKALDEVVTGRLLGDLDGDDRITVVDATIAQRCEAKMRDYPEDDEMLYPYGKICYYSDFNRDGERSVLDATCIQRYLVGAAFPIG